MPAVVVPALVSAATAGLTVGTLSAALISGAASLVMAGLSAAMAPKAPKAQAIQSQGVTRQFRQAITERNLVYGEDRVSGPIVYVRSTGNNEYLHLVIVLASHEVEEIGEVWLNDLSITDDMLTTNTVNTGRYNGLVRIKKHLGTTSQTADSDLVSEVTEWTTNHRLQGIAYIYVRLKWDRDVFASGIPNISAWVKGKKIFDTRTSTTYWTPNAGLMARDYLVDDLGFNTDASSIDTTTMDATANTCEEYVDVTSIQDAVVSIDTSTDIITLTGVNDRLQFQTGDKVIVTTTGTLPAGISDSTDYYVIVYQRKDTPRILLASSLANCLAGTNIDITDTGTGTHTVTKTAEPRYFGGGYVRTSQDRGENLERLLSAMGGRAVYTGGAWYLTAAEYQTPFADVFDESHIVGPIKVSTRVTRDERFNYIQGVYTSPLNDGNESDYPAVSNSTYETDDGEEIRKNLPLQYTQRPHTSQRIAKIDMERSRQEIIFSAPFNLDAFKLKVGDNFKFSFTRYGWSEKVFEVLEWSIGINGNTPIINMTCRENASAVYDWNNGEETAVDPAPNTTIPNPFTVTVVVGFSLDSVLVLTQGEDKTYKVIASWDAHDDEFVLSGGGYEVQWKRVNETVYKSNARVDGDVTEIQIPQLEPDTFYDIRIFAYNNLGVRSAESLIEDFQVGTTATTNTEDWENETLARSGDDWENDTLTSEDFEA